MIKNKNQSLRKPPPPQKKELVKQQIEKNSSFRQPPPPTKTESIKQQNEQHSLFNTMKDGFSFGIGSSIGHMIVNRIFSDKKENNISNSNDKNVSENKIFTDNKVEIINNTEILFKKYNECIENNKKDNDINECLKILEKNKIDF